jgi:hypothetical protein
VPFSIWLRGGRPKIVPLSGPARLCGYVVLSRPITTNLLPRLFAAPSPQASSESRGTCVNATRVFPKTKALKSYLVKYTVGEVHSLRHLIEQIGKTRRTRCPSGNSTTSQNSQSRENKRKNWSYRGNMLDRNHRPLQGQTNPQGRYSQVRTYTPY